MLIPAIVKNRAGLLTIGNCSERELGFRLALGDASVEVYKGVKR
jgi:hypothetical protein